jgi:hypothetical protein
MSTRTLEGVGGAVVRAVRVVALTAALLLAAACSSSPAVTPVPAFPTTAGVDEAGEPGAPDGSVPTDCNGMLAVDDLNALLGLPIGRVAARTTLGVPEPSVGRTERVACRYTLKPAGGTLLDLNAARYTDAEAATRQWTVNADVESGERRDLAIGAARAALFERAAETVLMVTYDDDTLTFVLPEGPRPPGRTRADVLVDLALRVLPTVGSGSRASTPTSSAAPAPAVAAG